MVNDRGKGKAPIAGDSEDDLPQPRGGGQHSWKKQTGEGCSSSSGGGITSADHDRDQESKDGSRRSNSFKDAQGNDITEAGLSVVPKSVWEKFVLMDGKWLAILLKKKLTKTDLCPERRILLLPKFIKVFLTDREKQILDFKGNDKMRHNKIDTIFFDTRGKVHSVPIRKLSRGYALTDPWMDVAVDINNRLSSGDVIQLWAFRTGENDETIVVALLKIKKDDDKDPKEKRVNKKLSLGSCFGGGSSSITV